MVRDLIFHEGADRGIPDNAAAAGNGKSKPGDDVVDPVSSGSGIV
jgi:hypothetical protein